MSQHSPPKCIFPQPCSINHKSERARIKNSATYFDCAPKTFSPRDHVTDFCSKHLCVVLLQAIWHCLTLNSAVLFSPSQTSKALGCGQHVTLAKTSNTKLCMDLKRFSTLDTRTSAYSYIFEQASVSHTCQWHGFHYKYMVVLMTTESISFVSLHDGVKNSLSCEL